MKPEASTWCRANDHIFSIVHVGWLSVARVERKRRTIPSYFHRGPAFQASRAATLT